MQNAEQLKSEGLAAFQRKDWQTAVSKFSAAQEQYSAQNNPAGEAEMWNNLGVLYRLQRTYSQSEQAFNQAIQQFQQLNDKKGQGQAIGNLGDLLIAKGNKKEALNAYLRAVPLLEDAKAFAELSQLLRTVSLQYLRQGQWLESIRLMEHSLSVKPRLGPGNWLFRSMLRFMMGLMGLSR